MALNLSQLQRELQRIEDDIRGKSGLPKHMDIMLPCRAAMDLSSIRFDVVKVTVRLGDAVLLHFFRDDINPTV